MADKMISAELWFYDINNTKLQIGCVDRKNTSSIYFVVQFWVTPNSDDFKQLKLLKRNMLNYIVKVLPDNFDKNRIILEENIVDYDNKINSKWKKGKSTFTELDVTLFNTSELKFKELVPELLGILDGFIAHIHKSLPNCEIKMTKR